MKAFLIVAAFAAALHGQVIRTVPCHLVRLDPALDSIVAPDSPIEVLGERFGLTEGPLWVKDTNGGYLLFSDCAANVIYKWQPEAPLSVFLERSGFTGRDNLNAGQQTIAGRLAILLIGSNGLAPDPQERLIITAMADRTLVRLETDGSRTSLADRYDGKLSAAPMTSW
jgi:gluconolactonase